MRIAEAAKNAAWMLMILTALGTVPVHAGLFGSSDKPGDKLETLLASPRDADALGGYTIHWQASLGLPAGAQIQFNEVFDDRMAILESGNVLSVIDTKSGKVLWRNAIGKPIERFTRPLREKDRPELVICAETRAFVFDINYGNELVKYPFFLAHATTKSPVLYEGFIVGGSANGILYAQDIRQGLVHWRYNMRAPISTEPAMSGSTLIATTTGGEVAALNPRSGVLLWRETTFKDIVRPPETANLMAYTPSTDQSLYAFDRNSGQIRWRYMTDVPLTHTPKALAQSVIQYVPGVGQVCLNAFNGQVQWIRKDWDETAKPVQAVQGLYYVHTPGMLQIVAAKDGATVKKVPLPKVSRILTTSVDGGDLYLINLDGRILKLTAPPKRPQ